MSTFRKRFSLRWLFIATTILAVAIAMIANQFEAVVMIACAILWLADFIYIARDWRKEVKLPWDSEMGPPPVHTFGSAKRKPCKRDSAGAPIEDRTSAL
jgi:hypothetical protein